jgi:hypothetical protein
MKRATRRVDTLRTILLPHPPKICVTTTPSFTAAETNLTPADRRSLRLPVDLSPVADLDDDHPPLAVVDLANDSIVSLADPVSHCASGELLRAKWPGIRFQGPDPGDDPLSLGLGLDLVQLLGSGSLQFDAISGHAA